MYMRLGIPAKGVCGQDPHFEVLEWLMPICKNVELFGPCLGPITYYETSHANVVLLPAASLMTTRKEVYHGPGGQPYVYI